MTAPPIAPNFFVTADVASRNRKPPSPFGLVGDLLAFDMGLEGRACKKRAHVVEQRINVRGGVSDRHGNLDIDDRIPGGGESAGQGQRTRQFRRGAA